MNLRVVANSFMLYVSLALIAYGLHSYLNSFFSLGETSIFNEAWQLIAIATGAAIITGFAYPMLRGVRKGDQLLALVKRETMDPHGNRAIFSEGVIAQALESGRVGKKIRVALANGALGEGVIESYAGALQPPLIRLTESERF